LLKLVTTGTLFPAVVRDDFPARLKYGFPAGLNLYAKTLPPVADTLNRVLVSLPSNMTRLIS